MAFCGFSGRGGPRFSGSVSVVGISVRGGGFLFRVQPVEMGEIFPVPEDWV